MTAEINGIIYQVKPYTKSQAKLDLLETFINNITGIYGNAVKKRMSPTNDLVKEFRLIQEKQSKLSAAQRKEITKEFHRHFQIVAIKDDK